MLATDVIVLGTPVCFYAMSAQLKAFLDRCCGLYTEMRNNFLNAAMLSEEIYFIASAAEGEEGRENLERVFDNLMGVVDCLDTLGVKGRILATGVWYIGEIEGHPALQETYEMGRQV